MSEGKTLRVRTEVQEERRLTSEVKDDNDSWARIRGVTLDLTSWLASAHKTFLHGAVWQTNDDSRVWWSVFFKLSTASVESLPTKSVGLYPVLKKLVHTECVFQRAMIPCCIDQHQSTTQHDAGLCWFFQQGNFKKKKKKKSFYTWSTSSVKYLKGIQNWFPIYIVYF